MTATTEMTLLSEPAFHLALSIITGGVAGLWTIHDIVLLARTRGAGSGPLLADRRFGYVMGIVIGMIGIIGTLRFNGVL
jgi:hypothetical protein